MNQEEMEVFRLTLIKDKHYFYSEATRKNRNISIWYEIL